MGCVLVTGAAGFLGGAVLPKLLHAGHGVRATFHRHEPRHSDGAVDWRRVDLAGAGELPGDLLRGVDTVIHLAARVHVSGPLRHWPGPFHSMNAEATRRLALRAQDSGVRRFIFLSTVGVHGNESSVQQGTPVPMRSSDPLRPITAYARSKLAGEQALTRICAQGAMELVTLRAPLVFGPGNGGNFLRLLKLIEYGLPLPAGSRAAPRSLVYVDNLAELLVICLTHTGVANQCFLLADFDLTVVALAEKLAQLLGRRLRTLRLPDWMLLGAALHGLTRPLLLDGAPIREACGWSPRIDADAALTRTVAWYRTGMGS